MLAITLHEPWVWAFTDCTKRIENREWTPQEDGRRIRRGEYVALHAGKTYDEEGALSLGWMLEDSDLVVPGVDELVTMAVGAVARFYGVPSLRGFVWPEKVSRESQVPWRAKTRHAWLFDQVWKLPSRVPCPGRRRLWELPSDVQEEVDHQWGKCERPCPNPT